jgi:signal transduction histidine kinase
VDDVSELQMLRSRLVTSVVEERRRVERALHDGVQQDLIGISVLLQHVRNLVATAPDAALATLEEAQHEVRGALGRVRALASDIYPAILEARGLPDALRQAVRASGATASVEAAEFGRYPAGIEAAVFFLWRDVLDNLGAGETARIRLFEKAETLQVKIEAGTPIDPLRAGDLVEGAGGTLTVWSESNGREVEAAFPLT